jgi:hypothetical protein
MNDDAVGKILSAGIQIGSREAKLLGVMFGCSVVQSVRSRPT